MAALTTITNISNQVIPILVGRIDSDRASESSDIPPTTASQLQIAVGAQMTVESNRLDLGQLTQLAKKKLISYQQTQ